MILTMVDTVQLKDRAAGAAITYVQSHMKVGLGTGTTSMLFIRRLAELLRQGQLSDIVGIPTSTAVGLEARRLGIPLSTLEEHPVLDVTIDGADEVAPNLNLIKGGGGALLREKIVAQATLQLVIIVDESKLAPALGTNWRVPIEVVPFGWRTQASFLSTLGADVIVRESENGEPYSTDQGNLILDCCFGPISNPAYLADQLDRRAGIVEHGLFLNMADRVIVAERGGIRHLTRQP